MNEHKNRGTIFSDNDNYFNIVSLLLNNIYSTYIRVDKLFLFLQIRNIRILSKDEATKRSRIFYQTRFIPSCDILLRRHPVHGTRYNLAISQITLHYPTLPFPSLKTPPCCSLLPRKVRKVRDVKKIFLWYVVRYNLRLQSWTFFSNSLGFAYR